jgi:hypothetical protein
MHTAVFPKPRWYEFDRQVDYGYSCHESLNPRPPFHQPLPTAPPPAGKPDEFCGCPACLSGGWYPVSPACRFWRPDCELCDGTRSYPYRAARWRTCRWRWRTTRCFVCQQAWHAAVTWFYFTLRNPHAAAQVLRQAVTQR